MWAQRIAREDLGCKAAAPPPLSTTCGAERRERSMRLARGYGSVSVSHSRSRCQHWCASIERAHRERQREEPKQCGRCSMSAADATGCGALLLFIYFQKISRKIRERADEQTQLAKRNARSAPSSAGAAWRPCRCAHARAALLRGRCGASGRGAAEGSAGRAGRAGTLLSLPRAGVSCCVRRAW